ncbi:hypothetical protein ACIRG5_15265 [Lentzea sp. NPDC102401]|uniref:hypothetical protein n=1 Tax=Lentzea sp. NPDC102401 TaxID=3364128 RepID=UPI0038219262
MSLAERGRLPMQAAPFAVPADGRRRRLYCAPPAHPAVALAWRDYWAEFTGRYGVDTLVPLLEVVSPDAASGI